MNDRTHKICPFCAEIIKTEAIKCRYCYRLLPKVKRRFYRYKDGCMVAGVCRGLSYYTRLPVTFIRLLFILLTATAGWGAFIYLALCLAPLAPRGEAGPDPAGQNTSSSSKTLRYLFFCIAGFFVYLPLGLFLLGSLVVTFFGIWYPVFSVDIFEFSLKEMGLPGVVLGISACMLLLLCICSLFHFIARLHFARSLLKNTMPILPVTLLLFAVAVSSFAVLCITYDRGLTKSYSADLSFDQKKLKLGGFERRCRVPIRRLVITTGARERIHVLCTVKARGISREKVTDYLDGIEMSWPDRCPLPLVQNVAGHSSFFLELSIEITLPKQADLQIDSLPFPLIITGDLGTVKVRVDSKDLSLKNCRADEFVVNLSDGSLAIGDCELKTLRIKNSRGKIYAHAVAADSAIVKNMQGQIEWRNCTVSHWIVDNGTGRLLFDRCYGAMDINDDNGHTKIYRPRFPEKSTSRLCTRTGSMQIVLGQSYPTLNIEQEAGIVRDIRDSCEPGSAVVNLYAGSGMIDIK